MEKRFFATAVALVLVWMTTTAFSAPPPFELTDTKGRKIAVEVTALKSTEVVGKRVTSGKKVEVALDKLDPENRKALEAFAKEHGLLDLYPELTVQVTVRDSTPRQKGSFYLRFNFMTPRMSIEGPRLEPIPAIKATVLTICAETKALYRDRQKVYAVKGRSTRTFEAVEAGDIRKRDFDTVKLQFDEDKNRTNVGGWIYKYWIAFLQEPESNRIIGFETNFVSLRKYLENNPAEIKTFLEKKVDEPIPSKY